MRLTTRSEYSLLALLHLARQAEGEFVNAERICEVTAISKKYLEQMLRGLRQAGLVRTRRGAEGGYALARPAPEITVAEVVRLMDGSLAATNSASVHFAATTPLAREKKAVLLFREVRDLVAARLERASLADLI